MGQASRLEGSAGHLERNNRIVYIHRPAVVERKELAALFTPQTGLRTRAIVQPARPNSIQVVNVAPKMSILHFHLRQTECPVYAALYWVFQGTIA